MIGLRRDALIAAVSVVLAGGCAATANAPRTEGGPAKAASNGDLAAPVSQVMPNGLRLIVQDRLAAGRPRGFESPFPHQIQIQQLGGHP